jgi:ABC-type sulfate transport system permease subunit
MYQFGWDLQNGTYIDISTVWYGVMLAEFIMAGLWAMSLVMGHVRGTSPITPMQARAIVEQWSYITVVSFAVYALIEFVT